MLGWLSFESIETSANIFSSSSFITFDFLIVFIALLKPLEDQLFYWIALFKKLLPVCFCSTNLTLPKAPTEKNVCYLQEQVIYDVKRKYNISKLVSKENSHLLQGYDIFCIRHQYYHSSRIQKFLDQLWSQILAHLIFLHLLLQLFHPFHFVKLAYLYHQY